MAPFHLVHLHLFSNPLSYQCRRCRRCGFSLWVGKIPWRRAWQPTPVFLPGECNGQRSLAGYRPSGCRAGCDWSDLVCMHHLFYWIPLEHSSPTPAFSPLRPCSLNPSSWSHLHCFLSRLDAQPSSMIFSLPLSRIDTLFSRILWFPLAFCLYFAGIYRR